MDSSLGYLIIIFFLVMISISIGLTVIWIWMLVHAITKNTTETQILWIALLIFFGPLAAIVYYFAVKKPMDAKPISGITEFK